MISNQFTAIKGYQQQAKDAHVVYSKADCRSLMVEYLPKIFTVISKGEIIHAI